MRVCIVVALVFVFAVTPVASKTASGTDTVEDLSVASLTVSSVEAVTLHRVTVAGALTVQSAGPGTAACALAIENSTIGYIRVTGSQFRCRITISRCTVGNSTVATAMEFASTGDSAASVVEISGSTLTGHTAAYRIPTMSGTHTIADTTLAVGSQQSPYYGNAVWVSSQLTGTLRILRSVVRVTEFRWTTSSGVYVGTVAGGSFLVDGTTITVRNNRNTRAITLGRVTSSCVMVKATTIDISCASSCSDTGYSAVSATTIVGSSFTVADSEIKMSTPGSWMLYTPHVHDTAVTVRDVKMTALLPGSTNRHYMWYMYRFRDSKAFLSNSRVEGVATCFRYPTTSYPSGTSPGSLIVAGNVLDCESSVASSNTPTYITVLAQCNTLQGGAVSQSTKVYGYGLVLDCGEQSSVLSLNAVPSDAAAELQTCAAFGSVAPFSRASSRNVVVTKSTTFENESFGTIALHGATSVVLRNCTVAVLLLKLNAATLQLLVDGSTIGSVSSATQFLGNATIVDSDIGNWLTPQAISFPSGTSSTSTFSVLNTDVTATSVGVEFGTVNGRLTFVESRVVVRGSINTVQGILLSSYLYGAVNVTRCTIRVNSTSSYSNVGADALFINRARGGIHLKESTLAAGTVRGTAIALHMTDVDAKGCVYVTGGSMTAYCGHVSWGVAYAAYARSITDGAVTFAHDASMKADASSASYGLYIQDMYAESILLLNSVELVALSRGRRSTLGARAFYLADTADHAVAVLESTTLRAPEGVCLYFPTYTSNPWGLVDIRDVYMAQCYRNSAFQNSVSYVRVSQNCLRLPGSVATSAPIGYSPSTSVYPCVNNTPRATPLEVSVDAAVSAATCAAFGSISPFRAPVITILTGTVTRSNESFGILIIEDPAAVTLVNVRAASITFSRGSNRRMAADRRAAPPTVAIRDSTVGSGGVRLSHYFHNIIFAVERTAIAATDAASTVPLLQINGMSGGSFTVRDSTIGGRVMFYNPSTISDAALLFQNTSFTAPTCLNCEADSHLNFYGTLRRTKLTFDGCSIRSTLSSASASRTRTAIFLRYLHLAIVTVNQMDAYLQHPYATRFMMVYSGYRASCITIANSSVTQACALGSTSQSSCRMSGSSSFFHGDDDPTYGSFFTLDNVRIEMYGFNARALYWSYLRNIDVVMSNVTADLAVRFSSSYFFQALSPRSAVVALLDSRVTMNLGSVYRFPTAVTYTSLLNLRSNFTAANALYSSVARINARQGCNTYRASNQNLGGSVACTATAVSGPCARSVTVYSALGISNNKQYIGGASSSSKKSSSSGSKVWIVGPVLGGCFVLGFLGYSFFKQQCNNEDEDNDNANNNNNNNVEDAGQVGNEHALFEDVNEEELRNFNLGENDVEVAQIFQEAPNDDARLNDLVRGEMGAGRGGMPPAAVPAAAPGLGDAGAQPSDVLTAEDDAIHPLIVAEQELAAVTRGEKAPPVELPLPYPEYATKAFERCRWRSPDGRSASFQAHDLYAGILYPYALSVTAYGVTSDVPHRLGLDHATWARAIQGASGPTVYGVCVRRAETVAESRHLRDQAGLQGEWMQEEGTLFVYAVTPFEPERLSLQTLLADDHTRPAVLSIAQRQVVASRVAAVYTKARAEGVYCSLHPAAVFVNPQEQTVSLKDRRADGMPEEAAAAAELLDFVRAVNPDADHSAIAVSVSDAVAIARAGVMTPEPSLAFLDDGSFPIKVDAECSICYCDVSSADAHMMGAECCAPARHFVCEECINMRVSAALTDAKTDFTSLPCAMAPACTSVWTFDDFGALVSPQNLRKWHKLSVQHAQQEAQQQAQANMEALQQQLAGGARVSAAQSELRRHVTEVRRCLRPACPHCGMPFESFTGCLAVKCGATDNNGRQVQGCGKEFCGACMVPTPCAARCGHRFVSPGQLHTMWQGWRREKVQQYLRANFRRGPQDQHRTDEERERMLNLALRAVRADFVTASIHPLGDGFPNPQ